LQRVHSASLAPEDEDAGLPAQEEHFVEFLKFGVFKFVALGEQRGSE
jgi:hypothetical protein